MIERVGVAGCGLMGSGIVEVSAKAGCDVVVREIDEGATGGRQSQGVEIAGPGCGEGKAGRGRARRGAGEDHLHHLPGRVCRPGHGDRGDHRIAEREERTVRLPRPRVPRRDDLRFQHELAHRDRHGCGHVTPGPLRRPPLLQPRAGHEAGRGRENDRHQSGHLRRRARLRRSGSARYPSRPGTTRASSSTCSWFPICSTRSGNWSAAWPASRTSTRR